MSFYKTDDSSVQEAISKYFQGVTHLYEKANKFSELFGAEKAICYFSNHDFCFGGLIFNPPKDYRFWFKPDRKNGTQYPRLRVPKMTDAEKVSHAEFMVKWQGNYPTMRPQILDRFYESIGTNWHSVSLSDMGFFIHENVVFIDTDLVLGPNVIEILGSEYQAAKAASQAGEK